jgi:ribose transport system permease protein
VTLAASFVIYGLAFWIAPAWVVYAPKNAPALLYPGQGRLLDIPMPIIVFLIAALMHLFFEDLDRRFVYAGRQSRGCATCGHFATSPDRTEYDRRVGMACRSGLDCTTGACKCPLRTRCRRHLGRGARRHQSDRRLSVLSASWCLIGTLLNAFTIMDVNSEVQNIIRGVAKRGHSARQLVAKARETARQGD